MALNYSGFFRGFALAGFMFAVAGCQSSDSGGAVAGGKPPEGKVLESELRAYCPRITLREGTAVFKTYAKGGEEDPTKLVYQASISDVTRSCSRAGGTLTINVAVAGKVVPGPAGKAGPVTLPIRIVILRGEEILYSQLHKHQVAVGNTSTQWIFSHPNVSIPIPAEQNLEVFAGFDEGPPKLTQ